QRPCSDSDTTEDNRSGTDTGTIANSDPDSLPIVGAFGAPVGVDRPGVLIVGEDHPGSDKHPVAEHCGPVEESVVLDLAVVANNQVVVDVDVASDDRSGTNGCSFSDLAQIPDHDPIT